MQTVTLTEAKSNLSKLVEAIEFGKQDEIVIARDGHPAARLVPVLSTNDDAQTDPSQTHNKVRFGLAKGRLSEPTYSDRDDADIAKLFNGDGE
jgi:prevent-host-death family protein